MTILYKSFLLGMLSLVLSITCFSQSDTVKTKAKTKRKIFLKLVNQSTSSYIYNIDWDYISNLNYYRSLKGELFQIQPYIVFAGHKYWYFQIGITDVKYSTTNDHADFEGNSTVFYGSSIQTTSFGSTFEVYRTVKNVGKFNFNFGMGINPLYSNTNHSLNTDKGGEFQRVTAWTARLLLIPDVSYQISKKISLSVSIPINVFGLNYYKVYSQYYGPIYYNSQVVSSNYSQNIENGYFEFLKLSYFDYIGLRIGFTVKLK